MSQPTALHEGRHLPSPVSRLLVFNFYDGALEGVLQVGDAGEAYRFSVVHDFDGGESDLRLFELAPLPGKALETLTALLSPYMMPNWPYWVPSWSFPSPSIQAEVDARVDEVLQQAGPIRWTIATTDFLGTLESVRQVPGVPNGVVAGEELKGSQPQGGTHAARSDQ